MRRHHDADVGTSGYSVRVGQISEQPEPASSASWKACDLGFLSAGKSASDPLTRPETAHSDLAAATRTPRPARGDAEHRDDGVPVHVGGRVGSVSAGVRPPAQPAGAVGAGTAGRATCSPPDLDGLGGVVAAGAGRQAAQVGAIVGCGSGATTPHTVHCARTASVTKMAGHRRRSWSARLLRPCGRLSWPSGGWVVKAERSCSACGGWFAYAIAYPPPVHCATCDPWRATEGDPPFAWALAARAFAARRAPAPPAPTTGRTMGWPTAADLAELAAAARRGDKDYRTKTKKLDPNGAGWGVRRELPEPKDREPTPRRHHRTQPFRLRGRLADYHRPPTTDGRPLCLTCWADLTATPRPELLASWQLAELPATWTAEALDAGRCLSCYVSQRARQPEPFRRVWVPIIGNGRLPDPGERFVVPRRGLGDKKAENWTTLQIVDGEPCELDSVRRGEPKDVVHMDLEQMATLREEVGEPFDELDDDRPPTVTEPAQLCENPDPDYAKATRWVTVDGKRLHVCKRCYDGTRRNRGRLPSPKLNARQRSRKGTDYLSPL